MENFDLKKYLAENKLLKETKEEDYYNLLMDLGGTELAGDTFEDMMYKRGQFVSFEDFLDDELDFFQEEGDVEIINKIKSTFLNENKLLKEAEYTEFVDDGENQFMDLDYNKIRAYVSSKKGPDFADDFMSDANEDFYENVVRFLDKMENPTDKEVLNFVDIEIEKR